MYVIKAIPDDFVVKERFSYALQESGRFQFVWLEKRNYTTMRAVEHISKALGVPSKAIRYAGIKDKNAVTGQMISMKPRKLDVSLKDITLSTMGYRDEPLHVGELDGNAFQIVVRNLNRPLHEKARVVNHFGEQRFSKANAKIGKAIIQKDLELACRLIEEHDMDTGSLITTMLEKRQKDYVGALSRLSPRVLRLYVHAYQSLLWNRMAQRLVAHYPDIDQCDLPLIGFGTEVQDAIVKEKVDEIMGEEGISYRDFIVRQFPRLSSEGDTRPLFVDLSDLAVGAMEDDDLHAGKKKCMVTFSLPPGSYATVVIHELLEA